MTQNRVMNSIRAGPRGCPRVSGKLSVCGCGDAGGGARRGERRPRVAGGRAAALERQSSPSRGRPESSAAVGRVPWVRVCFSETQGSPPRLAICFATSADSSHISF